jgi:hypothetical protein
MSAFIHYFKANKATANECNYRDNYYGDQVCIVNANSGARCR